MNKRWHIFLKHLTLSCQCQRFTASWYLILEKVTWRQRKTTNRYIYIVVHQAMWQWLFCLWGSRPLCKEELSSLAWWRGGSYQHVSWKGTIWSWHELASAKQKQHTCVSDVNHLSFIISRTQTDFLMIVNAFEHKHYIG